MKRKGYPMLKGVVEFWLSQLREDVRNGDGMLVVNPCNSPEHGPTTFGCVHYQQLIHKVFDAALSVSSLVNEGDTSFLADVSSSLKRLDKGFHIRYWGQIKEWKLPDSEGYDFMNDTHRHISELNGWCPGYSLSSFMNGYSKTLQSRMLSNRNCTAVAKAKAQMPMSDGQRLGVRPVGRA
jgi:alpha-L-fucosidase 2